MPSFCLQKATHPLRHIYNSFRHGARGSRFIPAPWSRASPGDASSGDTARSQQHGAAQAPAFDRFSPASGFSRSEQLRRSFIWALGEQRGDWEKTRLSNSGPRSTAPRATLCQLPTMGQSQSVPGMSFQKHSLVTADRAAVALSLGTIGHLKQNEVIGQTLGVGPQPGDPRSLNELGNWQQECGNLEDLGPLSELGMCEHFNMPDTRSRRTMPHPQSRAPGKGPRAGPREGPV